jgi:hypothetical protein
VVGDPYRGPARLQRRHCPRWNEKAGVHGMR